MILKWIKGILIGLGVLIFFLVITGNIDPAVQITTTVFGGAWTGLSRIGAFFTALFT